MIRNALPRHRILVALLAAFALMFSSCRSPQAGVPSQEQRQPVEKPWTKAAIESHDLLWLELSTSRCGYITGPVLASDEKGEFLTTKDDPAVHLTLSEVIVMDAVDPTKPAGPTSVAGVVAGSFLAFWGAVFYFLPAIALYLILA